MQRDAPVQSQLRLSKTRSENPTYFATQAWPNNVLQ
jgi:hypothetical protein